MGGCDVADMKRSLEMLRSKTYKWYLALFFYMIDVAVINAGVVWYSLKGQSQRPVARARGGCRELSRS